MLTKFNSIITSIVLLLGSLTVVQATEINLPGFTGSVKSTVTSGVSMRIERDCLNVRGYKKNDDTYRTWVSNNVASASQALYLAEDEGCSVIHTDGYGNTGTAVRDLMSENADDGNMNFDSGDIFDATSRVFTELSGNTDDGTSVNLSFVGSYNAFEKFTTPTFAPLTDDELDKVVTNVDILDAYFTSPINDDLDLTAGRFVTNWGESTFIPIGMNGLTTNALDLVALRKPGASIKEALLPTEQITLSGYLDGGWSFEAYYQFGESHINFDQPGMFYGSEVLGGKNLVMASNFGAPSTGQAQSTACGYLNTTYSSRSCDSTAVAVHNTTAGKALSALYMYEAGLKAMYNGDNKVALLNRAAALGTAAGTGWGAAVGDIPVLGSTYSSIAIAAWDEYTKKGGIKRGTVDLKGNGHFYADGEDQFGLSLRTYLDDVGTGVDIGFYFSQYDSKVPYFRFKGQQGLMSGDLLGMYTLAAATGDTLTAYLEGSAIGVTDGGVTLTSAETVGKGQVTLGLADVAYGEGACAAYQNPKAAVAMYGSRKTTYSATSDSNYHFTSAEKSRALRINYTDIDGLLYFDSTKCAVNASEAVFDTASTQLAAAALLGAALGPLNMAEYEFMYPENIKALGVSMNTNVGSTTVQAELTYRPNFPLATSAADQGQQLSDAVGTTNLLAQAVAKGGHDAAVLGGASAGAEAREAGLALSIAQYQANVAGGSEATGATILAALKSFNRSYLPRISAATVAAGDYYTTAFLENDTWSGTLGTTTIFSASHPLTQGLGADSTVLLTEFGAVYVPELSKTSGFVDRGGYRDGVGGEKCGGVTQAGPNFNAYPTHLKAADGLTHLGSSQTDPLFGNGAYCESQNGADDLSMTYRLIGSATYNNVANSTWSFSPSFSWSHDFYGYGPSSMGGFVPGKQSLSLSSNFTKDDMSIGLSYVNQLGDEKDNRAYDKDYLSANISYAF